MVMAEKIKKRVINLLPDKGDNLLNQFLSWALTVGRLLIIITETLALSVFLYRFSLDVKIVDLHEQIKSASAIVANFQGNEEKFRNIQARLTFIKEYDEKKDRTLTLLKEVVDLGRNKITFKRVSVTVNAIEIEAQAPSASTLTAFVQGVRSHPEVKGVSINRVENSTSNGLVTISVNAELKTNLRQTSITQPGQTQTQGQTIE